MFITRKHIQRRAFLRRCLGSRLRCPFWSPWFRAQTPLAKTAAVPKTRFTGIFVPHGMAPGYWVPDKPVLRPAISLYSGSRSNRFREKTVVMSGLWSKSAELSLRAQPEPTTGSPPPTCAATSPRKPPAPDIQDGTTIDQLIAQKIGAGKRSCRLFNSRSKIRARIRATAAKATVALIPTPSPGPRPRSRCRWNSIRRSSSRNYSATAAAPKSAPRTANRTAAFLDSDHHRPCPLQEGSRPKRSRAARRLHRRHPRNRTPSRDRQEVHRLPRPPRASSSPLVSRRLSTST